MKSRNKITNPARQFINTFILIVNTTLAYKGLKALTAHHFVYRHYTFKNNIITLLNYNICKFFLELLTREPKTELLRPCFLPNTQGTIISLAKLLYSCFILMSDAIKYPLLSHWINWIVTDKETMTCLNMYLPKGLPLHPAGDNYKPCSCQNRQQDHHYQLRRQWLSCCTNHWPWVHQEPKKKHLKYSTVNSFKLSTHTWGKWVKTETFKRKGRKVWRHTGRKDEKGGKRMRERERASKLGKKWGLGEQKRRKEGRKKREEGREAGRGEQGSQEKGVSRQQTGRKKGRKGGWDYWRKGRRKAGSKEGWEEGWMGEVME